MLQSSITDKGIFYYSSAKDETKTPLILLMGYSGSSDSWTKGFLEQLASSWPIIALDTRGTGKSTRDISESDLDYPNAADDIANFIKTLGYPKVHLLGYSYGGTIAMSFMKQYPELCQSLVLVATTLGGADYVPPPKGVLERLGNPDGKDLVEKTECIWKICLGDDRFPQHRAAMHEVLSSQTLTPRWVLAKHLNNYLTCSFRDAARESSLPVKVISGDRDPLTPAANSLKIHESFPNSSLTFIDDCCHMPYLEEPKKFIELIVHHLEKNNGE